MTNDQAKIRDLLARVAELEAERYRLVGFEERYWAVQRALDELLGPDEDDGAGEGIVADVYLVAEKHGRAGYDRAVANLRDEIRRVQWLRDEGRSVHPTLSEFVMYLEATKESTP